MKMNKKSPKEAFKNQKPIKIALKLHPSISQYWPIKIYSPFLL
jgi:hypothetical protein